tara:strand:- start:65363 stop:65878 length:516 start_codon:yes stop_codon:yes gene_type:complete
MTIHQILKIPNKILRQKSEVVTKIDKSVIRLLDDMAETMYDAPGIGLAAIQIGIKKRLLVIDCWQNEESRKDPLYLINPEVIWLSDDVATFKEGCLSIPEVYEEINRPSKCKIKYMNKKGGTEELNCEDILATCIQHEIDHLNGKLFIDHLSKLKRNTIERKFMKLKKRNE